MDNFIKKFEHAIKLNWDSIAIIDYDGAVTTYQQLAEIITYYHQLWKGWGLSKGDNIAICANNCAQYIELYMSIITGGYVAVLIPNNLSSDDIVCFVDHSDCKILYSDKVILDSIDFSRIRREITIVCIRSNPPIVYGRSLTSVLNDHIAQTDCLLKPEDISYSIDDLNSVCSILYTSGSSGNPKGAMLSYKNLCFCICTVSKHFPYFSGENYVSNLPFAHIFAIMNEILTPLCLGMQIIINRKPSPSHICNLLRRYHPTVFCSVPSVLIQLIKYIVEDIPPYDLNDLLQVGANTNIDFRYCCDRILSNMGGKIRTIFTGGAAIPDYFESLLVSRLKLPFITGYGMTECGVISVGKLGDYQLRSCGQLIESTIARIEYNQQGDIYGEIQIKDDMVFRGYYKDPISSSIAFTQDGWFRTGDIGHIERNHLFITGRKSNMLLASNGENIHPENIEAILNSMPCIKESLIIQRGDALHAIIVPDKDEINDEDIVYAVSEVNKRVPDFSIISTYEISVTPLERTGKGNIKRFLYK